MKCINELKKIGVEKIAAKTRITQDKVQNILNLNYGAFNKTHARGFRQIIEREFSVDLSEWMEAFDTFHSAPQEILEQNEQNNNDEKNINIIIESTKKDKSASILIALLALLVVFFLVFFAYNNFIKNPSQSVESSEIVLDSVDDKGAESNLDSAIGDESAESMADSAIDALDSAKQNADSADLAKQNIDSVTSANNATSANANSATSANIAQITISPNEPLWVGIIDLESRKKQQFSLSAERTISLEGDKIIRTGHSLFSISAPNLNKQFLGGNHAYLLYKVDSGLKEITHAEFLELNGGQEW